MSKYNKYKYEEECSLFEKENGDKKTVNEISYPNWMKKSINKRNKK